MYKKLCTQFYDLDKPSPPSGELEFYQKICLESSGRVIEPMCGTGRVLVPLAEAGVAIDGYDSSSAMLRECRKKLIQSNVSATIVKGDILRYVPRRKYSVAIVPACSLNLLTTQLSLKKAVSNINRMLLPGGRLVFDLLTDGYYANFSAGITTKALAGPRRNFYSMASVSQKKPNLTISSLNRYQHFRGLKWISDEEERMVIRCFKVSEIKKILASARFKNIQVEGDNAKQGNGSKKYESIIVIAEKAG